MKVSDLSTSLKELILRVLLREIGKDGKIEPFEDVCYKKILPALNLSRETIKTLKNQFKQTVRIHEYLGPLDFKSFYIGIIPGLLKEHTKQETLDVSLELNHIFQCQPIFSDARIKRIVQRLYLTSNCSVEGSLLQTNSANDNSESIKLLQSISDKDWQHALEDYEISLEEEKVNDAFNLQLTQETRVFSNGTLSSLAWVGLGCFSGLIVASAFGVPYILLSMCIAILIFSTKFLSTNDSTRPLLESSFSPLNAIEGIGFIIAFRFILELLINLAVFPSIEETIISLILLSSVSTGYIFLEATTRLENYFQHQIYWKKRRIFFQDHKSSDLDHILSPYDLIRFWETKVMEFIKEKKSLIRNQIKQTSKERDECLKTSQEMEKISASPIAQQLTMRQLELTSIIDQAQEVERIVFRIEEVYSQKITELQTILDNQRIQEEAPYRRELLQKKAQSLLRDTNITLEQWEHSKIEYQAEITSLMGNFQEQLLHTKDFIEAELSLKIQNKE